MLHPWHTVSFGKQAPEIVNAIIEIPKGSRAKYELDKETGLLKLDRVLYSSVTYPSNYGFIPQTYCDDKDPLDILVLAQVQVVPMCIVPARVIGVMHMIDGGEGDDKIIAVAADDISVNHINDITDLPPPVMAEIRQFFEEYKKLENKTVHVKGFSNRETAHQILLQAIKDYKVMASEVQGTEQILHYKLQAAAAGLAC